jgi:Doubled CXXCH motif (Paired_CXXCH_1)
VPVTYVLTVPRVRAVSAFIEDPVMRRRTKSAQTPKADRQAAPGSRRDRLAALVALVTVACLGLGFFLSEETHAPQFLMPGPLASAHSAIENCSACHTKSGGGKLSWIQSAVARDPLHDSKACLTCHKMPDTAFDAHSTSAEMLQHSTERLTRIAAATPVPTAAQAQSIAFPTHAMVERGLYCATCHQEHKGVNFKLSKISNEQCHSCHVVKFDSFDGNHPEFYNYPFKRRTQIIYDHIGHSGKHFAEVAKRDPAKPIPKTCSTCHNSRENRRVMAVAPFEQICTSCHLDQITGKERVTGPKGIAFLSVPGLDVETLRKRNAAIGEWPASSEAVLTPFMKVMISRTERGRALIRTVDRLNLLDLSDASDDQIKAVTSLVWEIKRLFFALISGKASDVLGNLNIACGPKLSANLVVDLTASIPRDVVIGAHQQWLPNLGREMANRQERTEKELGCLITTAGGWVTTMTELRFVADGQAATIAKPSRFARADQPTEARRAPDAVAQGSQQSARTDPHRRLDQGREGEAETARPKGAAVKADTRSAEAAGGKEALSASVQPPAKGADQTDDLLVLTEDERRGIAAPSKDAERAAQPEEAAGKDAASAGSDSAVPAAASKAEAIAPAAAATESDTAADEPRAMTAPAIGIESRVDPESWAEYGGWYRQDYAIFYRPTGHKDKFIYSWLSLTGPQATKGDANPAAAVFDYLASKDAQGSCTKCHSVDDIPDKGRVVNFSSLSVASKHGRITNFIHEPHFGVLENRGCLTCHNLERRNPYLQSYEQGNPKAFASNFGAVKKDLCQTCHTSSMARQDCLLCHKYHANGAITPIMNTRVPISE